MHARNTEYRYIYYSRLEGYWYYTSLSRKSDKFGLYVDILEAN